MICRMGFDFLVNNGKIEIDDEICSQTLEMIKKSQKIRKRLIKSYEKAVRVC